MKKFYYFILIIFSIGLLLFEMQFGQILGLHILERYFKFSLLIIFIIYSIRTIQLRNSKELTLYYIFPIIIYILSSSINILLSVLSNFSFINYSVELIPMFLALGIPYLLYKLNNKLFISSTWNIFNNILFISIAISSIEYYLAAEGKLALKQINIRGTEYLSGFTSIFHELSSGEIHLRFYGAFSEPGTAGMIILPALVYCLVRGNYIFAILYIAAIFLTKSLGALISLVFLPPLLILMKNKKSSLKIAFLGIFLILSTLYYGNIKEFYAGGLINRLEGDSADVRINNILGPINNLDKLIKTYPLGLKKEKDTESLKNNKLFFGSNFSPLSAFYNGGVFSFIGFMILLGTTYLIVIKQFLFKKNKSDYDIIFITSLILLFPFNFQRVPITGTILFGFLFAPYIILYLNKESIK